jgi:hypothetical protein
MYPTCWVPPVQRILLPYFLPQGSYTQLTGATLYNGTLGYGWTQSGVGSHDHGGTSGDLLRDVNSGGAPRTFAVDLANGTYHVVVTMGHRNSALTDNQVSGVAQLACKLGLQEA